MSITIRKAHLKDLSEIFELVNELARYEKDEQAVITTLDEYNREFEKGTFQCIVAESNERIVGMALYYLAYSTWKGRMLYLEDFVVGQHCRRQGIGELLFHAFLQEAKALDCVMTKWQVLDWNTPAVQFYEKKGATIERNWWNGKLMM